MSPDESKKVSVNLAEIEILVRARKRSPLEITHPPMENWQPCWAQLGNPSKHHENITSTAISV